MGDFIGLMFGAALSAILLGMGLALVRGLPQKPKRYPGGHYNKKRHRIEIERGTAKK